MYEIALKMILRDKKKYIVLISSIAVSAFLIIIEFSIFFAMMKLTSVQLFNSRATIWAIDPSSSHSVGLALLNKNKLSAVKSVEGVKWAFPIGITPSQARLNNGKMILVDLIGVDAESLAGIPPEILEGEISRLWESSSIIVDSEVIDQFKTQGNEVKLGDELLINDHQLKIVGIVRGKAPLFTNVSIYMPYQRVAEVMPNQESYLKAVLVEPQNGVDIDLLKKRIEEESGLKAYRDVELMWKTGIWFILNTLFPGSFLLGAFVGLAVGITVSFQTFAAFIGDNAKNIAALKVIGVSEKTLLRMVLLQVWMVGLIGYSIGAGTASIVGWIFYTKRITEIAMRLDIFIFALVIIMFSLQVAVYKTIKRITSIKPAEVFRG